jgi:sugar phosphate permease
METGTPFGPSPCERPTRVRWRIFVLACAVSWLLYLHRYAWGVIKPAFRQDNPFVSDTEIGWLDAAFNATYALGQVPCGLAGDLVGPRAILSALILVWSVAAAGVAGTHGFWRLFGVRAVFGLSQAGAYPVLNKMTRTWFPLSIRTSVQGIVAALGRIGAACCPVIVATLLMGLLGLSWQTALLVLTLPGVVLAVICWVVVRSSPREHPRSNLAEQQLVEAGMVPTPPGQRVALYLDRASLLSLGMLLLYAFASTFQDQLYVYWIPLFLREGRGLSPTQMGLFAPLPLLGGAAGGILGGILNDVLLRKTGNRRWTRSGVAFTGKFVAAGLVLLSVQAADGRVAMVVLLAARIFGDWSLPTQWGAITDMGGRAAGTVFGLVNMVGAAGGFVAGPVLGLLKHHYGWEGLFLGVVAMCLLSAVTWLFIDCTRRLVAD